MRNASKFDRPIVLGRLAADPSSPEAGSIYFNTADSSLRFYDGSSWTIISVGGGGANNALSNLTPTSVNQSLIPGTDLDIDIGSSSLIWRTAYAATVKSANHEETFAISGTVQNGDYILVADNPNRILKLRLNQAISGASLLPGTVIAAIDYDGNSVTLSNPAQATANETFTVTGDFGLTLTTINETATTGELHLMTGDSSNGDSGDIYIQTGDATPGYGTRGTVHIVANTVEFFTNNGTIGLNGSKLEGVGAPYYSTDGVNKAYVDALVGTPVFDGTNDVTGAVGNFEEQILHDTALLSAGEVGPTIFDSGSTIHTLNAGPGTLVSVVIEYTVMEYGTGITRNGTLNVAVNGGASPGDELGQNDSYVEQDVIGTGLTLTAVYDPGNVVNIYYGGTDANNCIIFYKKITRRAL